MIRKNELRSVVNETVLEWYEKNWMYAKSAYTEQKRKELVDQLVENIREVWHG